jgi:hypothetical protein
MRFAMMHGLFRSMKWVIAIKDTPDKCRYVNDTYNNDGTRCF